jgi:hypothetical protein
MVVNFVKVQTGDLEVVWPFSITEANLHWWSSSNMFISSLFFFTNFGFAKKDILRWGQYGNNRISARILNHNSNSLDATVTLWYLSNTWWGVGEYKTQYTFFVQPVVWWYWPWIQSVTGAWQCLRFKICFQKFPGNIEQIVAA